MEFIDKIDGFMTKIDSIYVFYVVEQSKFLKMTEFFRENYCFSYINIEKEV